eukprot:scaffold11892_cov58-Phaeocystis_antarctica.AAC.4
MVLLSYSSTATRKEPSRTQPRRNRRQSALPNCAAMCSSVKFSSSEVLVASRASFCSISSRKSCA